MRNYRLAMLLLAGLLGGCASAPRPKELPRETEYRLGAEDVVEVTVYQSEALSRTLPIRPDGKISLPLLGDVVAEGKTARQLADEISKDYGSYVQAPKVTVIVREVNAPRVFVIGEVAHPGAYPIRGELDVVQALALAGGLGDFASESSIVLIRRNDKGAEERSEINYDEIVKDADVRVPRLRAGDTIYVP